MSKSDLTPEGIKKDPPKTLLIYEIERRENCPEAFLFNDDELKLINRAREAILKVTSKYKDIPDDKFTDDLTAQIFAEIQAAITRRRVPLKKLQKLAEKAKT